MSNLKKEKKNQHGHKELQISNRISVCVFSIYLYKQQKKQHDVFFNQNVIIGLTVARY